MFDGLPHWLTGVVLIAIAALIAAYLFALGWLVLAVRGTRRR
jgi:hypothetical protein